MDRRLFIKTMFTLPLCVGNYLPAFEQPLPLIKKNNRNILILIELKGGNDGLNTLIPYKNELYYKYRPTIAIPEKNILQLNSSIGMHPALNEFSKLWEQGNLAWLQGVGYHNPNRSHFESIEKWDTASLQGTTTEGWISQVLIDKKLKGIAIDTTIGPLYTENLSSIGLIDPIQFAKIGSHIDQDNLKVTRSIPNSLQHVIDVQNSVHKLSNIFLEHLKNTKLPTIPFPQHAFGKDMQAVYNLILSGIDIPSYKVSLSNFDSHINQLNSHEKNLKTLSETLSIFIKNLQAVDLWNNTLILSYSEFGRRLQENANKGTDHGSAAPHFIMGGKVKGGLYGTYPSLEKLDERGDIIYTIDFRDIYASITERWWKSKQNIGQNKFDFL
ncbi:MAG: hypothetical protein RI964_1243 [Pseudomonadota bacterium]